MEEQQQRSKLGKRTSGKKAQGSAILILPVELLQHIVSLSIPQISRNLRNSRGIFLPLDKGDPHPNIVRAAINGISRYFQEILHNTPTAWTTLILDQQREGALFWLSKCLAHSGVHPLDVYLSSGVDIGRAYRQKLMSDLGPHFPRIRRLFCNIESSYMLQVIFRPVEDGSERAGNQSAFPILQDLSLAGNGVFTGLRNKVHLPALNYFSASPWFSVAFRHLTEGSLQSIKALRLSYTTGPLKPDLLELARCRNLEDLTWSKEGSHNTARIGSLVATGMLQLPCLRELRLSIHSIQVAVFFINALTAPQLTFLSIRVTAMPRSNSPKAMDFLAAIPGIKSSKLSHLMFQRIGFTSEGLKEIFQGIPRLTKLSFMQCVFSSTFFSTLSSTEDSTPCPELRQIYIHSSRFGEKDFVKFAEFAKLDDLQMVDCGVRETTLQELQRIYGDAFVAKRPQLLKGYISD
ncbi:hypothetical protein M422DRAFT_774025 [Sphaerobolus stellatus SS14]|nr:hypothetical protein M422DRAFT_774025 [Sphaerobolus stellatus SS14]